MSNLTHNDIPRVLTSATRRPRACIVSHRFGGFDGVSVEASKWMAALEQMGWSVRRAAGCIEGATRPGDTLVVGMWAETFGSTPPAPDTATIDALCREADLVILDNAGSLWTTPLAAACWEQGIRSAGVPGIVRHHDPPWQTPHMVTADEHLLPLRDPRMLHVTINAHTLVEFDRRWPELVESRALTVVHNTVEIDAVTDGDRVATRARLGVEDADLLVVQPARNIARKNSGVGLAVAQALQRHGRRAHFWFTDPVGPITTENLVAHPAVTIHRGWSDSIADLYAAADLIVLPSSWEGWGLPVVEAAAAGRPVAAGPYVVLDEIRALGFTVLDPRDTDAISALLDDGDALHAVISANSAAAATLSASTLPSTMARLVEQARTLVAMPGQR